MPNAHASLRLYKICQIVATFFCVKFSAKLQETHIEQNRAVQVGYKHEPYIIPFLSVK